MATTAKKAKQGLNVAAIQKILALLEQRHDEDGALIEELKRLIGGGQGIGEILQELYAYWNELWKVQHRGDYVFTFAKDAPTMKRLVRELGVEELRNRMLGYMKDNSDYVRNAKHPFGLFATSSNRYASLLAGAIDESAIDAVGCTHTPRCKSDQEHTRRKVTEAHA